jgi:hypothetical protein
MIDKNPTSLDHQLDDAQRERQRLLYDRFGIDARVQREADRDALLGILSAMHDQYCQ